MLSHRAGSRKQGKRGTNGEQCIQRGRARAGVGGEQAVFDVLAQTFMQDKDYAKLFQLRVLRKRFELGLPLIQNGPGEEVPADKRPEYEQAFVQAAREAGELFLAANDIPRAWPYFRAIGESAPVVAAIERTEEHENMAGIIEIAYQEQIHPRKGFELILKHYGICRAISSVFPVSHSGRQARLHWSAVAEPAPRPSQQLEEGHCAKGGSGTGDGKHL